MKFGRAIGKVCSWDSVEVEGAYWKIMRNEAGFERATQRDTRVSIDTQQAAAVESPARGLPRGVWGRRDGTSPGRRSPRASRLHALLRLPCEAPRDGHCPAGVFARTSVLTFIFPLEQRLWDAFITVALLLAVGKRSPWCGWKPRPPSSWKH